MASEEMTEKVIAALKKVPERRLLLIELANSIPIKNGMLDIPTLQAKQQEINLAEAEAKAYGAHTLMAVDSLVRLRAKEDGAQSVGYRLDNPEP